MKKKEAIEQMNAFGKARIPFLFVIDYEAKLPLVIPLSALDSAQILYVVGNKTNAQSRIEENNPLSFSKEPISFEQYQQAFERVKSELDYGNTYLVNLTQPTSIQMNRSLQSVFYQAKAPYKLWIKGQFVVFSPEIFVRIQANRIASFPMKGTIDASLPDAEKQILSNPKETAEHHTIVDLIRNDLSMIARNVRVERFRYIDRIQTNQKELLQVSSEIIGDLDEGFFDELGTHFFKLLPAGSISGAPKQKTTEIIAAAEKYDRGYYTGVFGIFDGKQLDSAVMIRFIEQQGDKLIFKSGGGITTFSNLNDEYQELIDKVYVPIY